MAPKQDEHGQWWYENERVYLIAHPEWKEQFLKRHEVKPNE